jgi:hypothetical protein
MMMVVVVVVVMMTTMTNELARGEINTWMLEITILVCLKIQLVST